MGRTQKCILTPNFELSKYLYTVVRIDLLLRDLNLKFLWGVKKKLLTILFSKCVCPSISADSVHSRHKKIAVKSYLSLFWESEIVHLNKYSVRWKQSQGGKKKKGKNVLIWALYSGLKIKTFMKQKQRMKILKEKEK